MVSKDIGKPSKINFLMMEFSHTIKFLSKEENMLSWCLIINVKFSTEPKSNQN